MRVSPASSGADIRMATSLDLKCSRGSACVLACCREVRACVNLHITYIHTSVQHNMYMHAYAHRM